MGSPPIPPHERTWRHPSELAAAERHAIRHTEAHRSTRAFAIATGTMGLVAVGMLVFTVTPRGQESPVAISATTSPIAAAAGAIPGFGVAAAAGVPQNALATPIGNGDHALMTRSGAASQSGAEFDVRLTTGPVVTAVVDRAAAGIVIVSISAGSDGHTIADARPAPDEMVTVLADPPVTVAYSAVDTIDAAEGTPVVDRDGFLVGLCTQVRVAGGGPIDMIDVVDVTDDRALAEPRVAATTVAP